MNQKHNLKQLPTPQLNNGSSIKNFADKKEEIIQYFLNSFETYEKLFDLLASDEAFYQQPEVLRHPLIFYYGHTATFFINKLSLAQIIHERINPEFESLFAIGVDEMSWDDLNHKRSDWPEVAEVREYRQKAKALVVRAINQLEFRMPITWESPEWTILMGIEHERIHLETSSVLIRQLDLKFIKPQKEWQSTFDRHSTAPKNQLLQVTGGKVDLTHLKNSNFYGWDNEFGEHRSEVKEFKASQYLVSNAEYLEFVKDGGYQTDTYWTDEGLHWKNFKKTEHPIFWKQAQGKYFYRSLQEEFELPLSWPVDVNYHEAKAFCNWKSQKLGVSIRLPSEDEWYRLRAQTINSDLIIDRANLNLNYGASSSPVNQFRQGDFYDVIGNVWQWTETPIYPFEGFEVHPLYDDFTTPTFDNKHHLIKGGSWASTGNEITQYSRYAFRRHFFQHAGFRYVQSEEQIQVNDINYESDTQVSQYTEFHFGDQYYGVANFAKKCADIAIESTQGKARKRALDLGCAVGRTCFELAREFEHVDGIDFSARFIKVAMELQEKGETRYLLKEEGELNSFRARKLSTLGLEAVRHKISFSQGDACNLKPSFNNYDLIFMGNLIDRLYDPKKALTDICERLNLGGVLIIASPYTWLEEFTKRENWLGGYKEPNGENLTTQDALDRLLLAGGRFKRLAKPFEIEFVIRETKRKFQHSLSEFNIYERVK